MSTMWGADVVIFPYMEQTAAWNGLQSFSSTTEDFNTGPTNDAMQFLIGPFPPYRCPSDSEVMKPSEYVRTIGTRGPFAGESIRPARSSVKWSLGDGIWNVSEAHHSNSGAVAAPNNPKTYTRGMFTAWHYKDFAFIQDGTSNTVGVSEAVCSDAAGDGATTMVTASSRVKGGITAGTFASPYTAAGNPVTPSRCLDNAFDPQDRTRLRRNTDALPWAVAWRGQLFGDGRVSNVGFQTVLPPNSPSCGNNVQSGGDSWGLFSATSHHPGGVTVAFMDGAIRFVTDTINTGDLSLTQGGHHEGTGTHPVQSGGSNYGVWGALGTPQAGESLSL